MEKKSKNQKIEEKNYDFNFTKAPSYLVQTYESKKEYEYDDYYKVDYFDSLEEAKSIADDIVLKDKYYKCVILDCNNNYEPVYEIEDKDLENEEESEI